MKRLKLFFGAADQGFEVGGFFFAFELGDVKDQGFGITPVVEELKRKVNEMKWQRLTVPKMVSIGQRQTGDALDGFGQACRGDGVVASSRRVVVG